MITVSPQHSAERAAASLAATLARLNSGTLGAAVAIYASDRPANGTASGGQAVATFILAKPAGTIASGVLTLSPVEDALIIATGIAKWARVTVNTGIVFDCDVSDMTGTSTIRLSATQLYEGASVRMSSGVLR